MDDVRRPPRGPVLALVALTCAALAGCSGGPAAPGPDQSPRVSGPPGSPSNPLVRTCADEAQPEGPAPVSAGPRDLAVGPVYFAGAWALATYTPAQYGWATLGRHGRFYKFGLVVRPGVVVTVTIGPSARGHAVIEMNVNGVNRGMTSVTYRSCRYGRRLLRPGHRLHPPAVPRLRAGRRHRGRPARDPPRHPAPVRPPLHVGPPAAARARPGGAGQYGRAAGLLRPAGVQVVG